MMPILILAEDHDPTVDRVVAALRERGAEPFRADTAWFPQRLSVAAELNGEAWSGILRGPARQIALRDVRSIWYRSPTGFRVDPRMSKAERRHAESEARLGLGGLLLSAQNALWVNHPGREADADYKPRQLVTARRCVTYACFDFAVGPGPEGSETFWFLEANCRGQHGWLERQTSLPISAAIADLLIEGDSA